MLSLHILPMLTWDKQTFGYGGKLRKDSKCVYIRKETEFLLKFDNIKCIWMFAVCITINTALIVALRCTKNRTHKQK